MELFSFDGAEIRTVEIDGELWFVAADVCAYLGLGNPTMAVSRLDRADLSQAEVRSDQRRLVNVISQAGLMELTFRSDKPDARKLTRYVITVVIPQWLAGRSAIRPPTTLELLRMATAEIEAAQALAAQAQVETQTVKRQLEAVAPDLDYLKELLDTPDALNLNRSAKEIGKHIPAGFGETRLRNLLRSGHEIEQHSTVPTQKAIEAGRMVQSGVRKAPHNGSAYRVGLTTPKGRYEYTGMLLRLRKPLVGMDIRTAMDDTLFGDDL
jgi:anti-repressor protein